MLSCQHLEAHDLRSARQMFSKPLHNYMRRKRLRHLEVHILRIACRAEGECRCERHLHMRVESLRVRHRQPRASTRAHKEIRIVEMRDVAQLLSLGNQTTIDEDAALLGYMLRIRRDDRTRFRRHSFLHTLCLHARIVDHIYAERRTDAAARTVCATAVLCKECCKRFLPLGLQEAFEHTRRGMCPR